MNDFVGTLSIDLGESLRHLYTLLHENQPNGTIPESFQNLMQ